MNFSTDNELNCLESKDYAGLSWHPLRKESVPQNASLLVKEELVCDLLTDYRYFLLVLHFSKYGVILLTMNRWKARWIIIQGLKSKVFVFQRKEHVLFTWQTKQLSLAKVHKMRNLIYAYTWLRYCLLYIGDIHMLWKRTDLKDYVLKQRGRRGSHRGDNPAIIYRNGSLDVTPHLSQD